MEGTPLCPLLNRPRTSATDDERVPFQSNQQESEDLTPPFSVQTSREKHQNALTRVASNGGVRSNATTRIAHKARDSFTLCFQPGQ